MKREIDAAREIRRKLEIVCARLESPNPESMDIAGGELNFAIGLLRNLERRLKNGGAESVHALDFTAEISAIRREASRAQALLESAGRFLGTWARLLKAETAGEEESAANYTRHALPGPVLAVDRGKMVLHG